MLRALRGGHRPDVILLDIMMPVMDGRQCLDALRTDERHRDIPSCCSPAMRGNGIGSAHSPEAPPTSCRSRCQSLEAILASLADDSAVSARVR